MDATNGNPGEGGASNQGLARDSHTGLSPRTGGRWAGLVGATLSDPSCTGHRELYGKLPLTAADGEELGSTGAVAQEKTVFASAGH